MLRPQRKAALLAPTIALAPMPYVKFPDEDVLMWYTTNLPGDGNAQQLDLTKPTILLIHGALTDSTSLDLQFDDPRLRDNYNMVAFDSRSAGRTRNSVDPSRDTWTEAADLIKAMHLLHLPASHLFACSLIAQEAALRLAYLWPDSCLSLAWVGSRASKEVPVWWGDAYLEVITTVTTAEDIETIEEVGNGLIHWVFGERMPEERKDSFVEYLEREYTGNSSPRFYDYHMILLHRTTVGEQELTLVKQPMLVIEGKDSPTYNIAHTELPDQLVSPDRVINAAKEAETHMINGPSLLYAVPPFSSTLNTLYLRFLATHSVQVPRSELSEPLETSMAGALSKLSYMCGDESIAQRDPRRSASFSLITAEIRAQRAAVLSRIASLSAKKNPYGILDRDGVPLRKFSERHIQQLFRRPEGHQSRPDYIRAVDVTIQSD